MPGIAFRERPAHSTAIRYEKEKAKMENAYEPTWNSLATHPAPQWFREAKFGIYTHWGPYSVPAYGRNGTWYPHCMYREDTKEYKHHVKTYGPPSEFGYKDFIPMFTAEKFDPEEWAELLKNAGARFAGPVAEHHDGFTMWDSKLTKWNAARMGPKRDVVGELEKAIRAQGLRFATTFHHANNWWFFPNWKKEFDCANPEYAGLYTRPHQEHERPDKEYLDRWRDKIIEVIDSYQPDLLWFDFALGRIQESYRKQFLAYYYNKEAEWGREVAVTYKEMPKGWHNLPPMCGVLDLEVGKMNELTAHAWITDTTVDAGPDGTWSYVKNVGYKSVERLVHNLVDRVSKNGYLLLNVGPRADGTIPEQAQECLLGIGKWLEVNGEAIYGTTPWFAYGEGPTKQEGGKHFNETGEPRYTAHDIRFTVKGNMLYAICLGRPGDAVTIKTLKSLYESEIKSVRMLGVDRDLKWQLDEEDGLTIETPPAMPSAHACAFSIELAE
ncbi:alpha-L-fucosidase [Candidatus Sumerlaeota bacterium]